jgi:hypothetical protein
MEVSMTLAVNGCRKTKNLRHPRSAGRRMVFEKLKIKLRVKVDRGGCSTDEEAEVDIAPTA